MRKRTFHFFKYLRTDAVYEKVEGDELYVFVCYSHEDVDVVYSELASLRKQGINIRYDEGISSGKNWRATARSGPQGSEKRYPESV